MPLAKYNVSDKCVLDKAQKRRYSFYCPLCKMVTFLEFETANNEFSIALLKAMVSCKIATSNKGGKNEMKRTKKTIAARLFEQ